MSNKEVAIGGAFSVSGNVGMDEVVSVFVSKYEDNLFDRKKDLSDQIKELKSKRENLEKKVQKSVDVSVYEFTNEVVGIESKVDKVDVNWNDNKLIIRLNVNDTSKTRSYGGTFSKSINVDIEESVTLVYKSLTTDIDELSSELLEVMGLIKSVSRKERQVRGRISELKLKESGYDNLLQNEEMLKLIQL